MKAEVILFEPVERRGSGRQDARYFSVSQNFSGKRTSVLVGEISETGCRLRGSLSVEKDDVVMIQLPDADELERRSGEIVFARVVWHSGRDVGCEFLPDHEAANLPLPEEREEPPPQRWPGPARVSLFIALSALLWFGIWLAL